LRPARRKTKKVYYGDVPIGGDSPISIQSMTTVPTKRYTEALDEIRRLEEAGCEIIRVAVQDMEDVEALGKIVKGSGVPIVADVHFDHRLAVGSASKDVAALRINPGNIGGRKKVEEVVRAAREGGVAIRIGVNSGSVEKEFGEIYNEEPAKALFLSAEKYLIMMQDLGFEELVFSLKSSDPMVTVEANRLFSSKYDYPLHIGVTEAGPVLSGTARSVSALTILLYEGIGDTVRISLSGDPVDEVIVAATLLQSLGLREDIPRIISCPTCGRSYIDVPGIASRLERRLLGIRKGLKIAVMGCEVNGPGEAKEADIGIAGTRSGAVLFKAGKVVRTLRGNIEEEFVGEVFKEIEKE